MTEPSFQHLSKINVNDKIEKKNGLSYLSWPFAVEQLLLADPAATWDYGAPVRFGSDTLMVFCTVKAFGKAMQAQLPVMDYRNKAIPDPDAFAVNTAMQRCLVKAIALHGLGLYIYAGEDLPDGDNNQEKPRSDANKSVGGYDFENLPAARQQAIDEIAMEIIGAFKEDEEKAFDQYCGARDGLAVVEEKTALRSRLPSNIKTKFEKINDQRNKT